MDTDASSDTSDTSMDIWYVRLDAGDVRVLTLEQLDDWFQRGRITGKTEVLAEGETTWRTLAEVAGLDDEPAKPVIAPPLSAPPPPVVSDVGADLDFDVPPALRSSKKKGVGIAFGVTVAVIGVALVVTKWGARADGPASAAANAAANAATQVTAPPPKVDPPAAPPPAAKPTLTDDQRKALLSADRARDKAREERAAKIKASKPRPVRTRRAPKSGNPFRKGGDKFDPLNSSL